MLTLGSLPPFRSVWIRRFKVSTTSLLFIMFLGVIGSAMVGAADLPCGGGGGQPPCPCLSTQPPCVLTAASYASGAAAASAYNNQRDAYNNNETVLTKAHVYTYGLVETSFSPLTVDTNDLPNYTQTYGAFPPSNPIYAEPLYVAGITVRSSTVTNSNPANCNSSTQCNMIVAVTLNGTIYAWNADGTQGGSLLWNRAGSNGNAGSNALWWDDCQQSGSGPVDLSGSSLPFEGILSTPVIDLSPSGSTTASATPVMFLTNRCKDTHSKIHWFLHEIDLTTGADYAAAYEITGQDSSGNNLIYANSWLNGVDDRYCGSTSCAVVFDQKTQHQRTALLEVKKFACDLHVSIEICCQMVGPPEDAAGLCVNSDTAIGSSRIRIHPIASGEAVALNTAA